MNRSSQESKITKDPTDLSSEQLIKQAINFHVQGNISEAAKNYQSFINQGFKDQRVFSNYGVILKNLGKLKEAELLLRKAIELNPNFANAHLILGNILKDLGKLKEAELSLRKAIEINPDYSEAYCNLGIILRCLDKLTEAELSYRKAIELNPDFVEALSNLGNILRRHGEYQEARLFSEKIMSIRSWSIAGSYSFNYELKSD